MLAQSAWGKTFLLLFCISYLSELNAETTPSITRTYTWQYRDKLYSIDYNFNSSSYNYYKKLKRTYGDFSTYLSESRNYPVANEFSHQFVKLADKNNFTDWQLVEFISAFVQSIPYVNDGRYEYPRYPIETLVDKFGDCEDTAILLEAILRELGFNSVLISPKNHMGVGIASKEEIAGSVFPYNNNKYYYIETTSAGWSIGDYPDHLSVDVLIYDPGQHDNAMLLAKNTSYYNDGHFAENSSLAQPQKNTATSPPGNNKNKPLSTSSPNNEYGSSAYKTKSKSSATIDVDEIIIDGQKETVITQKANNENGLQVVAKQE